jgi:SAM-dependent methyltransferase
MTLIHRWLCGSARWKKVVETRILPWTLEGLNLGSDVLEVGPGPGASTDLLHARVARLTCVEADDRFAGKLRRRLQGVRVMCEDAAAMSLPDESFDGAVCFTMLHHIPSVAKQDCLLREVARVLRPGGLFAGIDSLYSRSFRLPPVRHDGLGRPCDLSRAAKSCGVQRGSRRCNGAVRVSIPRKEVIAAASEGKRSM